MLLNPFTLHTPRTLDEAVKLHSSLEGVKIIAGGTFLMNSLKLLKRKGGKTPQHVLSLGKIEKLRGTSLDDKQLTIRAMTTISDLFDDPNLTDNFIVIRTVCRNISTNPIRNMATIGGNLTCRYTWTEMGAVMIALNADLHFMKPDGREEIIPAEQFFSNAAKTSYIFTHVSIPRDPNARVAYRRVKKTMHVDVPLLAVCLRTELKNNTLSGTRLAVNNGSAFAQRDRQFEDFLNGRSIEAGIADKALEHLDASIYDKRADAYKKHMFRVSIRSAVEEVTGTGEAQPKK